MSTDMMNRKDFIRRSLLLANGTVKIHHQRMSKRDAQKVDDGAQKRMKRQTLLSQFVLFNLSVQRAFADFQHS